MSRAPLPFPGAWPLQPCVSSCMERSCSALRVPGARLQDGAAATTLPDFRGGLFEGPWETSHSVAAFQSSALRWDLCWYKTSTASSFPSEPGLCPRAAWLQGQECFLDRTVPSSTEGIRPSHNSDSHQWKMQGPEKRDHCCLSFQLRIF